MTQEELSERSGISVVGIRNLERGRSIHPRSGTIHALADALGVVPFDLADPSLTASQVLRRAERSGDHSGGGSSGTLSLVASITPYPLAVSMALVTVGHLLSSQGIT